MMTRDEYLNAGREGTTGGSADFRVKQAIAHRRYYSQFVSDETKNVLLRHISKTEIKSSKSESFNDIPLRRWDALPALRSMKEGLKAAGDYLTLAGKVCIYKEAAQQIREKTE